jgi:DNA-binding protein H-NS
VRELLGEQRTGSWEPANLYPLLAALRERQEKLVAERAPELAQARRTLASVKQEVRQLGVALRRAGVSPEHLVPALRQALRGSAAPQAEALTGRFAAEAVGWGIEGYYDAD